MKTIAAILDKKGVMPGIRIASLLLAIMSLSLASGSVQRFVRYSRNPDNYTSDYLNQPTSDFAIAFLVGTFSVALLVFCEFHYRKHRHKADTA